MCVCVCGKNFKDLFTSYSTPCASLPFLFWEREKGVLGGREGGRGGGGDFTAFTASISRSVVAYLNRYLKNQIFRAIIYIPRHAGGEIDASS